MKLKFLIATLLMAAVIPALADFKTVSRAYEIRPVSISVPPTQNSRISFNECDGCDFMSARLTPNTRYSINGRSERFDEFRKAVLSAKHAEQAAIILLHHLESDTVVSVSVTF